MGRFSMGLMALRGVQTKHNFWVGCQGAKGRFSRGLLSIGWGPNFHRALWLQPLGGLCTKQPKNDADACFLRVSGADAF